MTTTTININEVGAPGRMQGRGTAHKAPAKILCMLFRFATVVAVPLGCHLPQDAAPPAVPDTKQATTRQSSIDPFDSDKIGRFMAYCEGHGIDLVPVAGSPGEWKVAKPAFQGYAVCYYFRVFNPANTTHPFANQPDSSLAYQNFNAQIRLAKSYPSLHAEVLQLTPADSAKVDAFDRRLSDLFLSYNGE